MEGRPAGRPFSRLAPAGSSDPGRPLAGGRSLRRVEECTGDGALDAARAAMAAGDLKAAAGALGPECDRPGEPQAHELLATLLYLDEDLDGARRQMELAFRGWRPSDPCRAALVAAELADLHASGFGNRAAARGWLQRAERLLEPHGRCVQRGYVDLALVACTTEDVERLAEVAAEALALALEFDDHDLEVRALADRGYALVVQGRTDEGFALLDEAMAALSAGEVANQVVAGKSYCALLSACDRAGDLRRAEEWTGLIEAMVLTPMGGGPRVLHSHCRLAYGSVLCSSGRWSEGESALLEAIGPTLPGYRVHRPDAAARLASVRLDQGRVDEAAALVSPFEAHWRSWEPLARVHLLSGRPELARAVALRGLDVVPGDRLAEASFLSVLVEVELACLDPKAASAYAGSLGELAEAARSPLLHALASLAAGRVAAAEGDLGGALARLDEAARAVGSDHRPMLVASIALESAQVRAEGGDTAGAVLDARRALDVLERLGPGPQADRARALLRSLGEPSGRPGRRSVDALAGLTVREQEVLELVRQGLTNAEIAERLYISPKTAEHHVGRVLGKLGVRSRAEAAAVATAAGMPAPGG